MDLDREEIDASQIAKQQRVLERLFFFSSRRRHTRYWRDWSSTCALPILDVSLHFGLVIPRGNEKIQKGVLIWGIKDLRLKEIREDELPRTVNLLQMLNDATESRPLQIDYGEYYEENVFRAKQMNQGKMLLSMML